MHKSILELPTTISKSDLLKILQERNQKWIKNKKGSDKINGSLHTIVLTCLDSRVALDHLFQSLPGEILLLKNAGNIITQDVIRSLILSIYEIGAKFFIILGHTSCGTSFRLEKEKIRKMKTKMGPETVKKIEKYAEMSLEDFLGIFNGGRDGIIKNVFHQKATIQKVIEDLLPTEFHPEIIPALYEIDTGNVLFLD